METDTLEIKSRRTLLAILAGVIAGLFLTIFMKPGFWGILLGVFVSVVLARVASLKGRALVGAITATPIGLFVVIMIYMGSIRLLNLLAVMVLMAGLGALCGLLVGLVLRLIKAKNFIP